MRYVVLLLAFVLLPRPAAAQAAYTVTWSGFEVGRFDVDLGYDAEAWRLSYRARTTGFLSRLAPWEATGLGQGPRKDGRYLPQSFQGASQWRGEPRNWSVRFDEAGKAVAVTVPPDDATDREPVPPALQVGPDPVALALDAITGAVSGKRREAVSFDGRRVIRYELTCLPEQPVEGVPMLECLVDGELIAGRSREYSQRQGLRGDARRPTSVFLQKGLMGDGWWPVRLVASTRFGNVVAELTSLGTTARGGS